MREIIRFNQDWKFIKQDENQAMGANFDDRSWKVVQLPHTWNAIDGANGFAYQQGACWYRKEFTLDKDVKGNRVFIEFNGANSVTDVYLNGNHIGQHRGGYSTFRFEITETIAFNEKNVLAVKVDNTIVDDVYPQMADFTFYGGIYRDVKIEQLKITDDVYSTFCTVGELFENEETKVIIRKILGEVEQHPMFNMIQGFTIDAVSQIVPDQINEKILYSLNKELTQIRKDIH